jgi:hypothetical protein
LAKTEHQKRTCTTGTQDAAQLLFFEELEPYGGRQQCSVEKQGRLQDSQDAGAPQLICSLFAPVQENHADLGADGSSVVSGRS